MSDITVVVPHDEIPKAETKILKAIMSLRKRPHRVAHLFGPKGAVRVCQHIEELGCVEDIRTCMANFVDFETELEDEDAIQGLAGAFATRLVEWAWEEARKAEETRAKKKARKMERRLQNRSRYLPEMVMSRESILNKDGSLKKNRWNGITDLKSGGTLRLAVEAIYGQQEIPVMFAIQNNMPEMAVMDDRGDIDMVKPDIEEERFEEMRRMGIVASGYRLGISAKDEDGNELPGWTWAKRLFPQAIDLRAYIHSLNAPTLPGGFGKFDVKFTTIMTLDSDGNPISAETDGCGRIHPNHPLFAQLQRPGGPCIIQIRYINPAGTFAKGILVPDERCRTADTWKLEMYLPGSDMDGEPDEVVIDGVDLDIPEHILRAFDYADDTVIIDAGVRYRLVQIMGEPQIWFDWMQVKGSKKSYAKRMSKLQRERDASGYIGVIAAWDRPRTLKWSFEQLQMFHVNPTTIRIAKEWIDEAYESFFGDGIDGLEAQLGRDNQQLKLVIQLACAINNLGIEFSSSQVPMVRRALDERVGRLLYFIAQGCGKNSKQLTAVRDQGVPEGHVVVAGFKPGTQVVVHRYPTHLPQCMMKLTVAKPLPHHKVDGRVVRNAIYMNKRDLTDRAQGDSDGDVMGVTSDPRALELMEHIIGDGRVKLVEPEGEKFEMKTDSAAGLSYIMGKPMGPVGIMCIWQAQLYAVLAETEAEAMAFPYQEAIDCNKRKVTPTNFPALADGTAWMAHPECPDRYHYTERLAQDFSDEDEFMKFVGSWVRGVLAKRGIKVKGAEKQNVIAWRRSSKRINPRTWMKCEEIGKWRGGNLVHEAHDYALEVWKKYEHLFNFDGPEVELSDILSRLLKAQGLEFTPLQIDWFQYSRTLRDKSGLAKFGSTMKTIMGKSMGDKERQAQVNTAIIELNATLSDLTLAEVECIWRMENTETYRGKDRYSGQVTYYSPDHGLGQLPQANNPNHAFRAVTHPGSIIMEMLGLSEGADTCPFLTGDNKYRVDILISRCCKDDNPHARLTEMIFNSTRHAKEIKVNGEGIPGHQCPECTTTLHNALIRRLRAERTTAEHNYIRKMCGALNPRS